MLSLNNKKEDSGLKNPDTYFRRSADPPAHLHCRFISLVAKGGDIGWLSQRQQGDRKQQDYCSVGYAIRQHRI